MSKLDQQLKEKLDEAQGKSDQKEINVLLHFKEGTDISNLQNRGFTLEKIISEEIGVASGFVTPDSVQSLLTLDGVKYLELDHEAHSLKNP